jgi:hypothetical protein
LVAASALALGLPGASSASLTVDGATLYGSRIGGLAGSSVAAAGDVNGDGIPDVIVGAPLTSTTDMGPARTKNGEAFVVFGPFGPHEMISLGKLGSRGFRIVGGDWYDAKDQLGAAVAGIGDINGDGYSDVAAMAQRGGAPNTDALRGYAAVIYGGPSTATIDLKAGIGTRGYLTYMPSPYYEHKYLSVSAAGDINGDGLPDFMFGDPQYYDSSAGTCTQCSNGDVYVEYGNRNRPGALDAGALGAAGYRIVGSGHLADLGVGLAPAGDINHDGIGDLALGEPGCTPNVMTPCAGGAVYVLYGQKSAPSTVTMPPSAGTGFRILAPPQSGGLGTAIASPGDVNGDGRPDLLLGMPYASFLGAGSGNGLAYIFFTPANPPATTDLGAPGAPAAVIEGAGHGDALGSAVASAGDIDGDGYADIAVSAPTAGDQQRGSVYVVRGLHSPGVLDLSQGLPVDAGYELTAPTPSYLGTSLADLGDLNHDGRDDLLAGAPGGDPAGVPNAGFAYVQFAAPVPSVLTGVAQNVTASAASIPATVTPSSQPTTVHIDFGSTPSLGMQSNAVDAGEGDGAATFRIPLGALAPATSYDYRAVAANASGTVYGKVRSFTTSATSLPGGGPAVGPTKPDLIAPVARIAAKPCRGTRRHCRRVRSRRASWRILNGTVTDAAPSSGIAVVEVSATTRRARHCAALGTRGFTRRSCKARPRYLTATVRRGVWSIALRGLPRGTVLIRARARDRAGNLQRRPATRTLHLTS